MIEENYNFSYKIANINIEMGTFEITYIPESEFLSPITLNQYLLLRPYTELVDDTGALLYQSQDDVPFSVHLENTIQVTKPLMQWHRQYLMLNNIEELSNAAGDITVNKTELSPPPP